MKKMIGKLSLLGFILFHSRNIQARHTGYGGRRTRIFPKSRRFIGEKREIFLFIKSSTIIQLLLKVVLVLVYKESWFIFVVLKLG